jgi:acyl dehydratase
MLFSELFVGQRAEVSKSITLADIKAFADLTGDFSPMHFDQEYAASTRFGGVIGHGLLTAGLISNVLGMKLPAKGTVYRSQSLRFKAPVYPGDTITAAAEVLELRPERKQVRLRTTVTNQRGEVVLEGEAEMLMLE